jgi:signal transduction histidine kinase/CheY-like chemotaxis protein
MNILIIDDISENIHSLKLIIKHKFNINIFSALNAKDAIQILLANEINLILTDIQMPEINGFEFVAYVKDIEKLKDIPVIFITAIFDSDDYKKKGYNLGVIDYIIKPIDIGVLEAKLSAYINLFKKNEKEIKRENIIFNTLESIVLITNGIELININDAFFKYYDFIDIQDFKSKHTCICDLFIKKNTDYLLSEINGIKWNKYIIQNPNILHKVCMIDRNGLERIFKVQSTSNFFTLESDIEEVIVFTDVTDLMRTKELLVEQSKHAAMGEMISMIAHQWRQPLTTLSTILNKMSIFRSLDKLDDNTFAESYKKSSELIQYMSKTIDDFRNFFRIDTSKNIILVNNLVKQSYSLIGSFFKENNIKAEILIDDSIKNLSLNINTSELTQVFINLYKNALDQIISQKIDQGSIQTKIFLENEYITIQIEDNANGIPDDIINSIFEPYFSTKSKNGTGLGLYMSKTIIEQHLNGFLRAFNRNKGACFEIKLPLGASK